MELTYDEIAASVTLPDWVEHPEPSPHVTLSTDDEITWTVEGDGYTYFTEDRIEDIYDNYAALGVSVEIKSALRGDTLYTSGGRILVSFTDTDHLKLLKNEYHGSQTLIENYRQNPDSFWDSYNMVNTHPAFWSRLKEEPTFDWETDGYTQKLWSCPMLGEDGGVVWALEAGQHVAPSYTHHYHDLRLDVYAPTLEEAYIRLAALVVKFFNDDGTEKEGVEYERSDLEILLAERLAEINPPDTP